MSALRILVTFKNSELNVSALSWDEQVRIIRRANTLWKAIRTPEMNYLALPGKDGKLYVYPGYYDECRCSEVEARLPEALGEVDLDDHHFNRTTLPDDVTEKSILYTEDNGILRERKLVGDIHPIHDNMSVRFEIVTIEDRVLSWLKSGDKSKCSSYINYLWFHKAKHSKIPEEIWDHYDFDRMMLDLWKKDEIRIVYDNGDDAFLRLEEVGEKYPAWAGNETEWFSDHPCKDSFYILY
jgi:hypothetical protein